MRTLALLLLLLPSFLFAAEARIEGPEAAKPGDLVVLSTADSKGDNFVWIVPQGIQTITCDGSKQIAFATATPGTLRFILVVADKEADISYAEHTVIIGVPRDPGPGKPTPAPEQPEPERPAGFESTSREFAPDDTETKTAIIASVLGATKSIKAQCDSGVCPALPQAMNIYQRSIQDALASRPRGDQNDWTGWRNALEIKFVEFDPTDLDSIIAAYKAVVDGLQ